MHTICRSQQKSTGDKKTVSTQEESSSILVLVKDKKISKSSEESSRTLEVAKDRKTQRTPNTAVVNDNGRNAGYTTFILAGYRAYRRSYTSFYD